MRTFEYGPTMLHAKTRCVDEGWGCVGTVNFDDRSFALNDEVTLCVQSDEFAGRLHRAFEADLEVSTRWTSGAGSTGRCASGRQSASGRSPGASSRRPRRRPSRM